MSSVTTARARLAYLDNLKVVLVAGVIVAHTAMTYGAIGSWMFEPAEYGAPKLAGPTEATLSALIGLGVLFGMGLFLLIAGLVTPPSLERKGPAAYARGRLFRLGLPVLVYVVIVMPALDVLVTATVGNPDDLTGAYFEAIARRIDTGPAWFLVVLLTMSLGWAGWRAVVPRRHAPDRPVHPSDLVVAGVLIAVLTFVTRIAFPLDSDQLLDAHVWLWPQCAALFAFGALSGERGWLQPVADDLRRRSGAVALVVAALAVGFVFATAGSDEDVFAGGLHWQSAAIAAFEGAFAVAMSVWVLGLFQRRYAHQGDVARALSRSAYGAFLLQAPVLVGLGLLLYPVGVATDVKFLLLAVGGLAASFGLAWLGIGLAGGWPAGGRAGPRREFR